MNVFPKPFLISHVGQLFILSFEMFGSRPKSFSAMLTRSKSFVLDDDDVMVVEDTLPEQSQVSQTEKQKNDLKKENEKKGGEDEKKGERTEKATTKALEVNTADTQPLDTWQEFFGKGATGIFKCAEST